MFTNSTAQRGRIDSGLIDEILQNVDLVALMENDYGLVLEQQSNGEFRGSCPFPDHVDKTPSFDVNVEKGIFFCRGCQKAGSAIQFLRFIEGVSFPEAISRLSELTGIGDVTDGDRAKRALRGIASMMEDFLAGADGTDLPGGLTPDQFMRSLADRFYKYEEKVQGDPYELAWVDMVYADADSMDNKNDHKGLYKLWTRLNTELSERLSAYRKRATETISEVQPPQAPPQVTAKVIASPSEILDRPDNDFDDCDYDE